MNQTPRLSLPARSRTARIGAPSPCCRATAASRSCRIRATPTRRRCSAIFRPRCRTARGLPADGPARLARTRSRARPPARAATSSYRSTGRARSIWSSAELRRVYSDYGPRAVFGGSYGWASAGRFHDAPAPTAPVSQCGGRVCPLGGQLQLGCGNSDPAARHRPAGRGRRQQRQLGRAGGRERPRARLWRHGAEEQRCRRRRDGRAHRAGPAARRPQSRRRIPSDRPAARRSAGRCPGSLAPDPSRHGCRADARCRAHADHRGAARPGLSRPILRRLRQFRELSPRPQ